MVKRRKRYVIVEAPPELPLEAFRKLIEKSYLELFGEFGLIEANLRVIKKIDNNFIIECSHNSVYKVILSLSSIRRLNGEPIHFKIIRVAGTIKKVREVIAEE